jgi:ribokinase
MKNETPKICVVGASNTDLLTKVPRLPKLGETIIGTHFHIGFGGKGANQAVMAARLGGKVGIVTKLGRDVFGKATCKNYLKEGIDTDNILWSKENSGVAPIFVDDEGHNFIVIVPGANWKLTPGDVRKSGKVIGEADVVLCQLEVPLETTIEALKLAKNALTIFNPAPARSLPEEIFGLCDIVVSNEVEAEAITGVAIRSLEDGKTAIKKLRGSKAAIITLGERGALVAQGSSITEIPTMPVKAVDSTGAGDAFVGTLAYFLAVTNDLQKSAQIANVAAALSVTRLGTQLSFPSRKEIDRAYEVFFKEKLF